MGNKPLYRIKFVGDPNFDGRYYSSKAAWSSVEKELADKMTHKEAVRVMNHLKHPKIQLFSKLELVTSIPR